jgi:DNA-binding MarR family transcriptional regulator
VTAPRRDDDLLTLVGLMAETSAGLFHELHGRIEDLLGPAAPWFPLLIRLARSPGGRLRMTDLAAQANLTVSGLTRAVDRLEALGLVSRETCPSDRRGVFAVLTPAGSKLMRPVLRQHASDIAQLVDPVLKPAEQVALADLLRKLRDHVHPSAARGA